MVKGKKTVIESVEKKEKTILPSNSLSITLPPDESKKSSTKNKKIKLSVLSEAQPKPKMNVSERSVYKMENLQTFAEREEMKDFTKLKVGKINKKENVLSKMVNDSISSMNLPNTVGLLRPASEISPSSIRSQNNTKTEENNKSEELPEFIDVVIKKNGKTKKCPDNYVIDKKINKCRRKTLKKNKKTLLPTEPKPNPSILYDRKLNEN